MPIPNLTTGTHLCSQRRYLSEPFLLCLYDFQCLFYAVSSVCFVRLPVSVLYDSHCLFCMIYTISSVSFVRFPVSVFYDFQCLFCAISSVCFVRFPVSVLYDFQCLFCTISSVCFVRFPMSVSSLFCAYSKAPSAIAVSWNFLSRPTKGKITLDQKTT